MTDHEFYNDWPTAEFRRVRSHLRSIESTVEDIKEELDWLEAQCARYAKALDAIYQTSFSGENDPQWMRSVALKALAGEK